MQDFLWQNSWQLFARFLLILSSGMIRFCWTFYRSGSAPLDKQAYYPYHRTCNKSRIHNVIIINHYFIIFWWVKVHEIASKWYCICCNCCRSPNLLQIASIHFDVYTLYFSMTLAKRHKFVARIKTTFLWFEVVGNTRWIPNRILFNFKSLVILFKTLLYFAAYLLTSVY